ncbi:MAG: TetR/AcrR family transcriptional regulator [Azoarcus sp.]|nr:TetR/AcrR family transcriptional regulator [Azoarcus sp.]
MPTITDDSVSAASPECTRAAARRTQILDAAAECFRSCGFHGASIARISQLAGMSGGHIYHYFDSKEAIIAAIVQRDLEHLIAIWAELRAARDVGEAMVRLSSEGVGDAMNPVIARLRLEILTEAARNPEVAHILRAADRCCMASLIETLLAARRAGGKQDDETTLAAMAEIVASMFEGLMIRAVRNPDLNSKRMSILVQRVMRQVIDSPDWRAMPTESDAAGTD